MSKALFSTLSILALLLSGINCATGKRGGSGGEGRPTVVEDGDGGCTVGLVLKPGDKCTGPNYKIRNNGGQFPLVTGSYMDSCGGSIKVARGRSVEHTDKFSHKSSTSPGIWSCGDLKLTGKDGNAWSIERLPPAAATER